MLCRDHGVISMDIIIREKNYREGNNKKRILVNINYWSDDSVTLFVLC